MDGFWKIWYFWKVTIASNNNQTLKLNYQNRLIYVLENSSFKTSTFRVFRCLEGLENSKTFLHVPLMLLKLLIKAN